MLRRIAPLSLFAILALASPLATVTGAGQYDTRLRAFLGSTPIRPTEAGRYHCHDLDYPLIRCYRSSTRLERAVRVRLEAPEGTEALSFVRVFEDVSYAGASAYLSRDYTRLGDIGWNDRISSFKVLNGGSGTFYEHIWYGGLMYDFCCNQNVYNVGSTYNDKFSSVEGSA
jgi:hypothetical protein